MAGYSKMDIMSMSEEEIKKALEEEGGDLPEHTIYFMVEELKRREQFEEAVLTVEEDSDLEESDGDVEEGLEEESDDEGVESEEPELTEEELEAKKKEEDRILIEEYQKSRKKTLRFALIGAGVAAVVVTVFILYLYGSGALS